MLWNSPTFMTWGSFFIQTINWTIIFPLLLKNFSTDEVALWFIFKIFLDIRNLADLGFSTSFSRIISYSFSDIKLGINNSEIKKINLSEIIPTMNKIYKRLSFISLIFLILSSAFLIKPINAIEKPLYGWVSWIIIILIIPQTLNGKKFTTLLEGANYIALYRRWSILIQMGSVFSGLIVLLISPNIILLVFLTQIWLVIAIFVYRFIAIKRLKLPREITKTYHIYKNVNDLVWPSAWRSSLGVFMSYGLIQFSGLLYAQLGDSESIATYLISLKLATTINSFSQAPFYSKIPLYNRYFAEGDFIKLLTTIKKGMKWSYWVFVISFCSVGIAAPFLLNLIGYDKAFASPLLWSLLGFAFFFERYGAMHIQLYSTTNKIIWHIANGFSGISYIFLCILLYSKHGILAFPLSLLIGNLFVYSIYSAFNSYKQFKMNFLEFELKSSLIPLLTLILFFIIYTGF